MSYFIYYILTQFTSSISSIIHNFNGFKSKQSTPKPNILYHHLSRLPHQIIIHNNQFTNQHIHTRQPYNQTPHTIHLKPSYRVRTPPLPWIDGLSIISNRIPIWLFGLQFLFRRQFPPNPCSSFLSPTYNFFSNILLNPYNSSFISLINKSNL